MDSEDKKHFMVLHERVALAEFDSEKKAGKFITKLIKEKAWLNNSGFYYIVEVKQRYRAL